MRCRHRRQRLLQLAAVCDVARRDRDVRAIPLQLSDKFLGALATKTPAADQQQMTNPPLDHEVSGQHAAQTTRTTGDIRGSRLSHTLIGSCCIIDSNATGATIAFYAA